MALLEMVVKETILLEMALLEKKGLLEMVLLALALVVNVVGQIYS